MLVATGDLTTSHVLLPPNLPTPRTHGSVLLNVSAGANAFGQAVDAAVTPQYDVVVVEEEEVRPATAPGGRGASSTEYNSTFPDSSPSADRGLQPVALEASYGGSNSVMDTAVAEVDGPPQSTGRGKGKGKGIKRSERQGSILHGFDDDAAGDALNACKEVDI